MPKSRVLSAVPLGAAGLWLTLASGCGTPQVVVAAAPEDAVDSKISFEVSAKDVPTVQADVEVSGEVAPDVGAEVLVASNVLGVTLQAPAALTLGGVGTLSLTVDHKEGPDGAPAVTETLQFLVDGKAMGMGVGAPTAGKNQPAIAIWPSLKDGEFVVAAVRPGAAKLQVTVDGVASAEWTVNATWPAGPILAVSTPTLQGACAAKRVTEVAPDTVRIDAQLFEPKGLDATLRFPEVAKSGDAFDLGKAPPKGSLALTLTVMAAAGPGKGVSPVAGWLWIDQSDKGLFRGTFLGKTQEQTPVVGAFVVERDGDFGIDILDEPTLVEASSLPTPESDIHASRVAVNAIGNGKVLVTWRRIKNVTQAEIARWVIDAKTGDAVKNLPPLVNANVGPWKRTPDPSSEPTLGWVSAAANAKKILVAWEGKGGKDAFAAPSPKAVWLRGLEADGGFSTLGMFAKNEPVAVSDDPCDGTCAPQVLAITNAKFLILWSPAKGGIWSRRLEPDYSKFTDPNPVQLIAPPATSALASVLDATMAVMWRDPALGSYLRVYTINPGAISSANQEETIGGVATGVPTPGVGVFAGDSPGFLAFAVDGTPPTSLKMQRIDFTGTPVVGAAEVATGVGQIRVQAGESPQVTVLVGQADANAALPLSLRKFTTTTPVDGGTQLGVTVPLPATASGPLFAALCYVPEVDVYVVAWSGDYKSDGVSFQRFR